MAPVDPSQLDPATAYAQSVVKGEVVTGRLVRLAAERHLRDQKDGRRRGRRRGLKWEPTAAAHALEFFSYLRLPGGRPFKLEPFQQFIVGSLAGWKSSDGSRRFRTGYCEIGKGNGKTPLGAGLALYGLAADGEPAAEVYCAATTREQASIAFRDAKLMAEASPALQSRLDVGEHNIAFKATDSFLRPVSSEHRGLDGKRPHVALIDEVHEHPDALVVDKMRAGTKSRRQALIFEITNSGYDRDSVCWHHHEYSRQILEGLAHDDSWFAYVCTLDPCPACLAAGKSQPAAGCPDCDDWRDERCWLKANPGLGTVLPEKYLREQVREAAGMPSKENIVKRLNFCLWTEQSVRWLNMEKWDACSGEVDLEALQGQECYAGLDLASTTDTAALVLLFPRGAVDGEIPPGDGGGLGEAGGGLPAYVLLPFFWVPEEACKERERRNKTRLDGWVREGLIEATPGDVIDYDRIRKKLNDLARLYDVKKVACDRWNATQLATQLAGDGFAVEFVTQGFASLTAPTKELEGLVLSGRLRHGGHPVLRWMAGNVSVDTDAAGNLKPSKKTSLEKIDGISALANALAVALVDADAGSDDPGIVTVGPPGDAPARRPEPDGEDW